MRQYVSSVPRAEAPAIPDRAHHRLSPLVVCGPVPRSRNGRQRRGPCNARFESGEYPIRRGDLLAFLDLYGVTNKRQRDSLLALREEVWRTGWWDGYAGDVDHGFIDYVWLENRAGLVRTYDVELIPGLLQIERYARAVIATAEPDATQEQIAHGSNCE